MVRTHFEILQTFLPYKDNQMYQIFVSTHKTQSQNNKNTGLEGMRTGKQIVI